MYSAVMWELHFFFYLWLHTVLHFTEMYCTIKYYLHFTLKIKVLFEILSNVLMLYTVLVVLLSNVLMLYNVLFVLLSNL